MRIRFICILIVLSSIFNNFNYAGEIRDTAISTIKKKFTEDVFIKSYKLTLDKNITLLAEKFAKQRFLGKYVYYYEIYKSNDIIGYAILDNVKGKVKPITFLVIFNTDYSVNSVDIIKYREQYGGAVENRSWLNQFNSKSVESELELNKTIDGISGATISVKSVLNGVKRLLYFISNLDEYERNLFVSIE